MFTMLFSRPFPSESNTGALSTQDSAQIQGNGTNPSLTEVPRHDDPTILTYASLPTMKPVPNRSTTDFEPPTISGANVTTTMRTQVEETIEAIRPALRADNGDIELKDVDEATGIVTVTLIGACGTCPASTQTLKQGIERIMRDRVDGVTEVVNV